MAACACSIMLAAACSSFGADTPPTAVGDAGPDGNAADAGSDAATEAAVGACGAPLGTLTAYANDATEITSVAADATTLWFTTATDVFRKDANAAPEHVAPALGAGSIALTATHAFWLAAVSVDDGTRALWVTTRAPGGVPGYVRRYAELTLSTSADAAFYGNRYGVCVGRASDAPSGRPSPSLPMLPHKALRPRPSPSVARRSRSSARRRSEPCKLSS